jgi:hypothetical protein
MAGVSWGAPALLLAVVGRSDHTNMSKASDAALSAKQ